MTSDVDKEACSEHGESKCYICWSILCRHYKNPELCVICLHPINIPLHLWHLQMVNKIQKQHFKCPVCNGFQKREQFINEKNRIKEDCMGITMTLEEWKIQEAINTLISYNVLPETYLKAFDCYHIEKIKNSSLKNG